MNERHHSISDTVVSNSRSCMQFRLMNALTTFQFYISCSLQGLLNEFMIIYLDVIFIYSESEENYKKHVRQVLYCLRESELFIKLKKMHFLCKAGRVSKIHYLSTRNKHELYQSEYSARLINFTLSEGHSVLSKFLQFLSSFYQKIQQSSSCLDWVN